VGMPDLQHQEVLSTEFAQLATCLRSWPDGALPDDLTFPHLRRLSRCLLAARTAPDSVGWGDLAAMVRQALRVGERSPEGRSVEARFSVPTEASGHPWPSAEQWRRCSVQAERNGLTYQLTAAPWRPEWSAAAVDERVSGAPHQVVRDYSLVPADPFLKATFPWSATDFAHYTSDAHQQAVRTVMACAESATVIVNLPTGAGKSTVALAPAFARAQPAGVSVMIVPTIALALDQERRVRELLGGSSRHFAYTSSAPDSARATMRSAIRDGLQSIIFVSPEGVTRSLAPALFHAARKGLLRYFIIDEAHLVDQWGSEFRPEFQAMAGMRSELLASQVAEGHAGFRTLLMTATMPPSTADLLVDLFGAPGPVETAIGNALRPEPSYFTAEFPGSKARAEAVVQALRHLPRPAILYSSRPYFAGKRYEELRAAGFRRLALFTGESTDDDRHRVLTGFRDGSIDVVVATSAFGLGVDQDDVRTIIHACIPETIDRFYQEVGRAGRDGRASISVLLWTKGDRKDAHSFSHPRLIGAELGVARWTELVRGGRHDERDSSRLLVQLAALRPGLERFSEENEKWNVRTLGLLVRAGLVRPSWDVPPESWTPDDTEASGEEEATNTMAVRLEAGAIDEALWAERVDPVRDRARTESDRSHNSMLAALKAGAAVCELIRSAYDLARVSHIPSDRHHGAPVLSCGGCPAHPDGWPMGVRPRVPPVGSTVALQASTVSPLLQSGRVGLVSYRTPVTRGQWQSFGEKLTELIRHLVSSGLRMLVAEPAVANLTSVAELLSDIHLQVLERLFFVEARRRLTPTMLDWLPGLPTMIVVGPSQTVPHDWLQSGAYVRPLVVMIPDDLPDPERPDRRLVEMRLGLRSLDGLTQGDLN